MITQDTVKDLFEYRDGHLYWAVKFTDKINIGDRAGHIKHGRMYTKINKKDYLVHRLIYLYHHGNLPATIDHIDNDKTNNRIENLRACTQTQNMQNRKLSVKNTSGFKNVSFDKPRNKWKVEMKVNGKYKLIGRFEDIELADLVAMMAREKYHKEFANHG